MIPEMPPPPKRVIVDPAVQEEEEIFERMMARFRAMTREDYLRWGLECGFLNPDGSYRPPQGDPCVTRVEPNPAG